MATKRVTVRATHPSQKDRKFAAILTVTNRLTNKVVVNKESIPESGGTFDLEINARYKFEADPRDEKFGTGSKPNTKILSSTKTVDVRVAPMGEECRIWLEDIKGMIAEGANQKAKRQIRLAKEVYTGLVDPPKETADIFENILKLEKGLP